MSNKRRYNAKPLWQLEIARDRIKRLFAAAEKDFPQHPTAARKYLELAKKIGMRYNVRMASQQKRRVCKKCFSYLVSGISCTIRANPKQKAMVITCKNCGHISRFPYRKEKKLKK